MSKPGITIIEETEGSGAIIGKADQVQILYDLQLNKGDFVFRDKVETYDLRRRTQTIAALRYGIEGMREGGARTFRASPHLCYGERGAPAAGIPENAVLTFTIKSIKRDYSDPRDWLRKPPNVGFLARIGKWLRGD